MINHPNRSKAAKRAAVTYSIREKVKTFCGEPITEYQVMHGNKIVERFSTHEAAEARLNGLLKPGYRVVYGETMPSWEQTFPTLRQANAFAQKHRSFGDIIFSIAPVVPGEDPKSLTGMIEAGRPIERATHDLKAVYQQSR